MNNPPDKDARVSKFGHGSNVGQVSNLSSDGHEKFAAIPMTGWKPVLRKSGILNHAKKQASDNGWWAKQTLLLEGKPCRPYKLSGKVL